jgi:hypothetical protein
MADQIVATPEGTPPAGELEPEPQGTPPEGEGAPTPTPQEPAPDTDAEGAAETEAVAWESLRAKYPNLSEEALREKVAEQLWGKTNYAKEQRERAERLERENKELRERQRPEPKAEPEAPHPDVEKLTNKIKGLVKKDEGLFAEAEAAAKRYRIANEEALELKGMAKQAKATGEEDASDRLAARADAASAKATAEQTNWKLIASRREEISERVNELIAEQQFVDHYARQSEAEAKEERRETQEAIDAFPGWIDQQTVELAKAHGLADDKHTMTRLHKHVRRAMHYDLASPELKDRPLRTIPAKRMVEGHIKEFMTDNDIKERRKFKETSEAKLGVSTPAGKSGSPSPKAPGGEPPKAPPRPKGPVPVSYLARGGEAIPEAWRRGREYLKSRGID